jgi:hypothetical protein
MFIFWSTSIKTFEHKRTYLINRVREKILLLPQCIAVVRLSSASYCKHSNDDENNNNDGDDDDDDDEANVVVLVDEEKKDSGDELAHDIAD